MTGEVCVTLLNDANVRELVSRSEGVETLNWNTLMSTLEDTSSLKVTILPSRDGFQRAFHISSNADMEKDTGRPQVDKVEPVTVLRVAHAVPG